MVMIIFNLIEFFNVKIPFLLCFLIPLCFFSGFWWLICSLLFFISFVFMFFLPYFFCWGNLGYFFGCDLISYGLILLSLWICVLMIRESIFRSCYFSGFFVFVVVFLMIILYCTFSRVGLLSFYVFFERRLIPTLFLILGKCTSFIWLWFRWRFFFGFEWPHCTVCVQRMIFCVSRFILVFVAWNTFKSRTSENEMKLWNRWFQITVIYFRDIRCFKLLCT
jgi:hypothetical protein